MIYSTLMEMDLDWPTYYELIRNAEKCVLCGASWTKAKKCLGFYTESNKGKWYESVSP